MDARKDILWRAYLVYFIICLFAVAIVSKIFIIQVVQGEEWISKAESLTTAYRNIEAVRGNIYSSDGSLLATSVPIYEVRMDMKCEALSDKEFYDEVDSLAYSLYKLFDDRSEGEWRKKLVTARKRGDRYHLIKRKVNYNELKKMKTFPILRKGRYKGGVIYLQQNIRQLPFKNLAARTIGYEVEDVAPVGMEGAYSTDLRGVSGKRLMQKIAGGVWMPINDENEIEPEDGKDVFSTIDINIQDVAHHALLRQLEKQQADHGCVALMEVETGKIRAIANLSRNANGTYSEKYNYVIGESTEPGSTFKLASLMVAMEDGFINLTDSINTEDGKVKFYDRWMKDSHEGGYGKISVKQAFALSSNVAVSKIVNSNYAKNPQLFVDKINKMNIASPLNIGLNGEGKAVVKNTKDKSWSGVTLPWMSIGYELRLTPLHILTFYNAVANNGKMVKPMFVEEMRSRGDLVKKFETEVINPAICSEKTIKKAKEMLEEVVEKGTASNLKNANFKIAGKTGTAQIANDRYGYKYDTKISYQASFVGYFPADKPKYSCIVVVNAPSKFVYYGNLVAGPIFKEIADKVYSTSIQYHEELKDMRSLAEHITIPVSKSGSASELNEVFDELKVPVKKTEDDAAWVITQTTEKRVETLPRKVKNDFVPNVVGMTAKDALYLLENAGLHVQMAGKGAVKNQSIQAGAKVIKGETISIVLS